MEELNVNDHNSSVSNPEKKLIAELAVGDIGKILHRHEPVQRGPVSKNEITYLENELSRQGGSIDFQDTKYRRVTSIKHKQYGESK